MRAHETLGQPTITSEIRAHQTCLSQHIAQVMNERPNDAQRVELEHAAHQERQKREGANWGIGQPGANMPESLGGLKAK